MKRIKNFLNIKNAFKLQAVYKNYQATITLNGKASIYDLKRSAAEAFNIPVSSIILSRKTLHNKLEYPDNTPLSKINLHSKDIVIVERMQASLIRRNSLNSSRFQQTPDSNGLIMVKRVIPADNSCLFSAIAYATENKNRSQTKDLRQVVASYVASEPAKYNQAFLDKTNEAYQRWIMDELNWGGGIELEILSKYYGVEICVIDTKTFNSNTFGSDQKYKNRIYLFYDGAHYDVVVKNISEDMPENMDVTYFEPQDHVAFDGAMMLAKEVNFKAKDMYNTSPARQGLCSPSLQVQQNTDSYFKWNEVA